MEANDNQTVVDKAVNFVKDVFGIQHDTAPRLEPEYPETAPEVTAENAMRLDPNAFAVGEMNAEGYIPSTENARETDAERLRREVGEYPPQKTASELNAESAWHEDNG